MTLGGMKMAKLPSINIQPIPYDKEKVEHLTDQLIKLQRCFDSSNSISGKAEITTAMKNINKSLEITLTPRMILTHPNT
jgi:hypothetical protein